MIYTDAIRAWPRCTYVVDDYKQAVLLGFELWHRKGCAGLDPMDPYPAEVVLYAPMGRMFETWWENNFPEPLLEEADRLRDISIRNLRSCAFGAPKDRAAYEEGLAACQFEADTKEFLRSWAALHGRKGHHDPVASANRIADQLEFEWL